MRYIIYGAGGVGGVVGGKLHMAGHEVVLIARGKHLELLQRDGLKLKHPNPDTVEALPIPAVSHPSEIAFREDDVVLLTMKSQDTAAALEDLRMAAGNDAVPVICLQNGVENERVALRRFRNVYGVLVIMPANYVEPGIVDTTSWPMTGVLDIGRYPEGVDEVCERFVADLTGAGFAAEANPQVMRLKYTKLNQNMVNAMQAILPPDAEYNDITNKARAEAEACFAAAGIDWAPTSEMMARTRSTGGAPGGIGGGGWRGGSTWQSIVRGTGSSETDYINGEIVLLGHLHGVPVPVNETLQLFVDRLARTHGEPGSVSVEELRGEISRRESSG
jgi:2-dehydropantoate 2-reductase